jgi:hypothetical protein
MWLYDDKPVDESELENYVGFVYVIENKTDNRMYIGKKLLKFKRTKKIKGRNRKVSVDSDWKKYWGSNKNLQEDVLELGEDKFQRKILRLCKSKGEMNYYEAKYQFELGALESDQYYNDAIMVRVHRSHLKHLKIARAESLK